MFAYEYEVCPRYIPFIFNMADVSPKPSILFPCLYMLLESLHPKSTPTLSSTPQIDSRPSHIPGLSPLSAAHNTIALAYNKLGLSCAALKHYDEALRVDPLNSDCYIGKGELDISYLVSILLRFCHLYSFWLALNLTIFFSKKEP